MTPVRIPHGVAAEVLTHARAEIPNEACGFLSGSLATGQVTRFHPARNLDASPLRFEMHPEDQVRITLAIEAAGEELVAIFHSHARSAAVPSPTDRRMALDPDPFYLIASLAHPEAPPASALRAWRIVRGQAVEVPLTIG